jgi:uncharacterized protein (TIGR03089 family)
MMSDVNDLPSPLTFPTVLARALRTDPGRPFVTFYDEATGERVELSLTTYANWVAKAGSLLVDEHGLERGQAIRVDLPPHWLSFVFLGAAWSTGLVVVDEAYDATPDVVVCGPASLARWAAAGPLVLASALLPLGVRFPAANGPLPAGVHDIGVEIWGQPDGFSPWDPPVADDPATSWGLTQQEMWAAAAGALDDQRHSGGSRLLSETDPASPPGAASLTAPLLQGGSVVLVAGAGADRLAAIAAAERVTDRFPRTGDQG